MPAGTRQTPAPNWVVGATGDPPGAMHDRDVAKPVQETGHRRDSLLRIGEGRVADIGDKSPRQSRLPIVGPVRRALSDDVSFNQPDSSPQPVDLGDQAKRTQTIRLDRNVLFRYVVRATRLKL